MKNVLKVTAVAEKTATDGRKFKSCSLQAIEYVTMVDPFTGQETVATGTVIPAHINIWERDSDAIGGRVNMDYPNWKVGSLKVGKKVTREVAPYTIPDTTTGDVKTMTTASVVVIGDSTSENWENLVKKAFKNQSFELVTTAAVAPKVTEGHF